MFVEGITTTYMPAKVPVKSLAPFRGGKATRCEVATFLARIDYSDWNEYNRFDRRIDVIWRAANAGGWKVEYEALGLEETSPARWEYVPVADPGVIALPTREYVIATHGRYIVTFHFECGYSEAGCVS